MNDKSFQIIDENGNLINCEIICIVPNEEDSTSSYIVYTDFKTENGYKLLCGELKETDGSYTINKITDDTIIDLLKDKAELRFKREADAEVVINFLEEFETS